MSAYAQKVERDMRLRAPGMGRACDYERSRAAAVSLKCMACAGGRNEVGACAVYDCALWTFRPHNDGRERPAGAVPTPAEYEALCAARTPDGAVERLAAARAAKTGAEPMPTWEGA